MAVDTQTQPSWYALSHHDRYRKLNIVRRKWCRRPYREIQDRRDRTVYLDGTWITDVPSFYLSLGEAVNGTNGYFGGGLDALSDCLSGGFGVYPPLTVYLSHFDEVRNALDGRAWCRFRAESFQRVAIDCAGTENIANTGYFGDGSDIEIARWTAKYTAALAGEPFDCDEFSSYFDAILEVFKDGGAELVPHN